MKSFDLGLLTALNALLQTGSVTAAARRMHLSTPAMSHTLARLRETLGDPLLVRAGRKLVPTPRALALAEPVRRLLDEAGQLLQPGSERSLDTLARRFVIRAPEGIALVFGATLDQALQRVMPLAQVEFQPEGHGAPAALRDGDIDLDIGTFASVPPEVCVMQLFEQALVGAVRSGHPLATGRTGPPGRPQGEHRRAQHEGIRVSLKRFAAARHVGTLLRAGEASPLDEALAQAGHARFIAITVPSAYSALVLASRSDLVACVGERIARAMQPALDLQLFALPMAVPALPLRMAWHPRHAADPAHRWLRDCVQVSLGQALPLVYPVHTG